MAAYLDASGLEPVKAVTTADGDDFYRLEAPFEPSMEETSEPEGVIIFEPIEAVAYDDESSTAEISIVFGNCACAHLILES